MTDATFDETAPPAAISTPAEDDKALAWTAQVIAMIALCLALFSAASMRSWAETLPPTPTNAVIREAAETWAGWTDQIGLSAPRSALHEAWTQVRAAKF